ncbi:MAG: MerR family transcriptional regulator [Bacteroidota bacterium]
MKDFGIKKLYYSISEVSKITGLEQYILRYWETEFEDLRPSKNRAGNRIYTNKDIQKILKIKKLLRDEKYTIEGAKNVIRDINWEDNGNEVTPAKFSAPAETVQPSKEETIEDKLKRDLKEIKDFLLSLSEKL